MLVALTPFRWIISKVLRVFILFGYRIYLLVRAKSSPLTEPAKNIFLFVFTNRYTIHGVIIAIAVFTGASSINAYEVRSENYGEGSILYHLVGNEEQELIEEGLDLSALSLDKTYNGDDAMAVLPQVDYSPRAYDELSHTVAEGSALVQPTISGSGDSIATRTQVEEYVVQPGDTINIIAQKFGLSTATLLWANNLSSSSYIHAGDKLIILPVSGVLHTVKKGETVAGIAKEYKADVEKIVEYNKLADASSITIGDKLVVPGGVKRASVAAATTRYTAPVSSIFGSTPPAGSSSISRTRLLWPTSGHVITQYYHWKHHGLDIDGDYSSPLYAAEAGVVEYAGWNGGYGIMVQINHGGGMVTRYGHASKLFVKKGDYVSRGQTIAMMGTTGYSTGTHLHFEVIINGGKYNPLSYIR